jgi:preprotein translocase subunit SecF
MYQIIKARKIWFSISGVLVAVSIVFLLMWGLKFGIDFTGGSLLEVKFLENRPSVTEVNSALADLNLGSLVTQPVDENGMIFRFQNIDEDIHQEVLKRLRELVASDEQRGENMEVTETQNEPDETLEVDSNTESDQEDSLAIASVEELRFDAVGPSIGSELKKKSVSAIFIVLIAMIAYIAWAFRFVSKPVASWKYGLAATIALFHDVIITMGVFSFLGYFYNVEISTAFVAAILTVLGYSVNDTIIVFDRIRENLPKSDENFEDTVNISVNQSISRSINTSFTTLIVLLSIFFFGGETIRDFVLALAVGISIGTYSSIFLASPILVLWEKIWRK